MANPKHVKILRLGVDPWNKWREENSIIVPTLNQANLQGIELDGADLGSSYFKETDLRGASLKEANFNGAILIRADL